MTIDAVIFDMDGTLIDSEPMWQLAEKTVFSNLGVHVDKRSKQTASMTTKAVTAFWFQHYPWQGKSLSQVEQEVIDHVGQSINTTGRPMCGTLSLLKQLSTQQIPLGLATNSPKQLADIVLDTLDIGHFFQTICTSDDVTIGKPDPEIYQTALDRLNVKASHAIAIEDSLTGITAAKLAGMKTVAIMPESNRTDKADLTITNLSQLNLDKLSAMLN